MASFLDTLIPKKRAGSDEGKKPLYIEEFVSLIVPGVPVPIIGFIDVITTDDIPTDFKTSGKSWSEKQAAERKEAIGRLIANRKIMSRDDDAALRGLNNAKLLSKDANKVLKTAHKAVRHTAKKIKAFRGWITWLFAFGLVGLGMQITVKSMKQAGGQPAVIGGIVGATKAIASLIVVVLLISETV